MVGIRLWLNGGGLRVVVKGWWVKVGGLSVVG